LDLPSPRGTPDAKGDGGAEFTLTSAGLEAKLAKDRQMAQAKYRGQTIELSGTVKSSAPNYYGQGSVIDFAAAEPFGAGVLCTTKDRIAPGTLARGQTVRVRGKWSNLGPALVDCVVVERGPDTAVRASAQQVAKDFTSDADKARETYENRTLVIRGEVATVKNDPDVPIIRIVELKGDGHTVVLCRFGSSDEERKIPESLKAGDKVAFAGEVVRAEKGLVVVGPATWLPRSDTERTWAGGVTGGCPRSSRARRR
jgi:tRNA_anti-like